MVIKKHEVVNVDQFWSHGKQCSLKRLISTVFDSNFLGHSLPIILIIVCSLHNLLLVVS